MHVSAPSTEGVWIILYTLSNLRDILVCLWPRLRLDDHGIPRQVRFFAHYAMWCGARVGVLIDSFPFTKGLPESKGETIGAQISVESQRDAKSCMARCDEGYWIFEENAQ